VPKALIEQDVERLAEMARQDMAQRGMDPKDMQLPRNCSPPRPSAACAWA
jgi:trigger factor